MALVKDPLGGSAASGKMSGKVYARNRAGNYVRAWAKPVNPVTDRQSEVRGLFGGSSALWALLTLSQVASWEAYAAQLTRLNRLGEPYTPKGRQIFMEINQNLQQAAQATVNDPPMTKDNPSVTDVAGFAVTETGGTLDGFDVTSTTVVIPSSGAGFIVVEATPPYNPTKNNVNNLFRQIFTDNAGGGPFDMLAAYTAVFGTTANASQLITIRVRVIDADSGLGSSWFYVKAVIA